MDDSVYDRVLTGARVIDPAGNLDRITDVALKGGKIAAVGDGLRSEGAEYLDLSGSVVVPGLVDLHCHVYGILGFSDPDRVGVYQGVTTFVEPGGPGVWTYDEFHELIVGRTVTDLYVGPYIGPLGIIGFESVEGDIRSFVDIPLNQWLDVVEKHRDTFRYLKIGAFGNFGGGILKLGKGLAEILGVPLYVHIGDFLGAPPSSTTAKAFAVAEAGDMITHLYHGNPGNILDERGRVLKEVCDAERRGVIFDIGFGSFNFSFDVAEKAFAQGILPQVISSDLQQINVTGPTYSLANVMSILLNLGLSLPQVIERVTINPARALNLDDGTGTLRVGAAADISVLRIEEGNFTFADCAGGSRQGTSRIVPTLTFKGGRPYVAKLDWAQEERNWYMQVSESAVPARAGNLDPTQRQFLGRLARELAGKPWDASRIEMDTMVALHRRFRAAQQGVGLPLRDALEAVYACFIEEPFTYQAGMFLARIDRALVLDRVQTVARGEVALA